MRIIGYKRSSFTTTEGNTVHGYNVYLATEIAPNYGYGLSVERVYLSDAKLAKENLVLEDLVDRPLKVYFNRYGKVDTIVVLE